MIGTLAWDPTGLGRPIALEAEVSRDRPIKHGQPFSGIDNTRDATKQLSEPQTAGWAALALLR